MRTQSWSIKFPFCQTQHKPQLHKDVFYQSSLYLPCSELDHRSNLFCLVCSTDRVSVFTSVSLSLSPKGRAMLLLKRAHSVSRECLWPCSSFGTCYRLPVWCFVYIPFCVALPLTVLKSEDVILKAAIKFFISSFILKYLPSTCYI